ncbi:aromatic amino acid lyase [Streptomyces sp. NPDC096132]|uniref:aromatic amino acid lyase n=1 Tax=Streptomyces sp. NPDC096132 TaxID=3366075 RepID=UPI00380465AF
MPPYGLTTGLGTRSSYALPREELEVFSVRTVRGRADAVGDPLQIPVVRAAVLARVNGLAGGGSGVRPEILTLLVALLNARVYPVIPKVGSIGAADLVQLAHVGLSSSVRATPSSPARCSTALRRAGLAPAVLGPKAGSRPRLRHPRAEDDSTKAALGARRLATILVRLRRLLAVESVVAAQAVDLAAPPVLGRGPQFLPARSGTSCPAGTTSGPAGWTWRR